jgi:hypothetical protein
MIAEGTWVRIEDGQFAGREGYVHGHRHLGPSKPDIEHVIAVVSGRPPPEHLDYFDIPESMLSIPAHD